MTTSSYAGPFENCKKKYIVITDIVKKNEKYRESCPEISFFTPNTAGPIFFFFFFKVALTSEVP